jgi:hypothetical protein
MSTTDTTSMSHEVISAFLDDEPFEPQALVNALADPAGRELLIDLIAVRGLAKLESASPTALLLPPRRSSRLYVALASAAVVVALVGGYRLGQLKGGVDASPPAATVVVEGSDWQPIPVIGGGR